MRYAITAPRPGFKGEVVGVRFDDGKAVLDAAASPAALAYFQRHTAYVIEPLDAAAPQVSGEALPPRPAKNASAETWRTYARTIGVDPELVDAAESRADLIELVDARLSEENDQ